MRAPTPTPDPGPPESYLRIVANLALLLAVVVGIGFAALRRPPAKTAAPPRAPSPPPRVEVPAPPAPEPVVEVPARPAVAPPPALDREAVARAEAEVDAARRDRERAEARARAASEGLSTAVTRSSSAALSGRTLASRVRDPSARIVRANTRGGFLKSERDRLKDEIAALAKAPKPRRALPIDQSPVASTTEGDEFHFEIRRDRVGVIDLDRLIERAKADAKLRIRMIDRSGPIVATVGPVGSYSLQYELGRSVLDSLGMVDLRGPTYSMLGFEIIPEGELRGETYDVALRPASEFSRAINRLNPEKSTITIWIYPDGFPLYRKLRDHLHERGFLVAARPLPFGIPIRGSPNGTNSAGQ
jgi:hypothetical protein